MRTFGLCTICGKPATNTCMLCGKLVCNFCYTQEGVCRGCKRGKRLFEEELLKS